MNQQGLFADKNREGTQVDVLLFISERLGEKEFKMPKSRSGCHRNNAACFDQMICNLH